MRRTPFANFEYLNSEDLNNIGIFSQEALDALTADAVGLGRYWTGMNVSKASQNTARVVVGRIYKDGVFYGEPDTDEVIVDIATIKPTSARMYAAIVGYGNGPDGEEANFKPRSIKNQVTGLKEPQNLPTEVRRIVTIDKVKGAESSSPVKPDLEPQYVVLAWLLLSPSGIESVETAEETRMPSLELQNGRIKLLEDFRTETGSRIDTIQTDLAVTNSKIASVNAPLLRQMPKRVARLENLFGVNNDVALWGFDRFMDDTGTDKTGVGYKARVEEGLRFPWAAEQLVIPSLLDPNEPRVKTSSGWTLPLYTEERRVDIWGQYISVNLSSYQYANTSFTIFPGASRRRRYGPSQIFTSNSDLWAGVEYARNYLTNTFQIAGQNWRVTDEWVDGGVTYVRAEQYWDDEIKYWNGFRSLTATAANGYCLGQTFLNARAGWLTKIGLRFQKVDPAADVKVFLCLAPKGIPDPEQVVATGQILAGQAKASDAGAGVENGVQLTPVYLDPGTRYGVVLVTTGDYAVSCVTTNALSNGSLFFSDGNTFVADLGKDMSVRLYFAKFVNPYVTVDLNTVTLPGGISDMDLISTEQVPEGTAIEFQFQKDGLWYRLESTDGTNPLASLPQTVKMRVVFWGTTDVMPGIRFTDSRLTLRRADDDFVHWSAIRNAGENVTSVIVELTINNWKSAKHALLSQIVYGANVTEAPDTTVDTVNADGTLTRRMSFSPTATQTYKIKLTGTTTDPVDGFAVSERYDEAA